MDNGKNENKELRDLGTHMSGATDMHEGIETDAPVQIDAPAAGSGSPFDAREDRFKTQSNGK